jgi:cytochrome c oxidase subunit 2
MIALAILASRGIQSALEPAGVHADRIGRLWDIFLGVSAVVYVLVILALIAALLRRPKTGEGTGGVLRTVSIATGISVLTLFGLLVASIVTTRSIANPRTPEELRGTPGTRGTPIQMIVTGHQWWWQIEYTGADPSQRITTANELTIPAGVPVNIELRSSDVIHSFWVPNLNGKMDLIPGHKNGIVLQADRPGVYRGQCAEFCGQQHAKMGLWVNVLAPADFAKWSAAQLQPSKIPSTAEQRKGQETFMSSPCPLCHTIAGTDASGKTAPDLTHLASRRSLAAATLPNRRGYLAGWILDPQHIKPGNQMPPMVLEKGELEPLLAYLESLQ